MEKITLEHKAMGTIVINRYNGGHDHLFGQTKTNKQAVSIELETATLDNRDFKLGGHGSLVSSIQMTNEQFSTLLLNKDMENGTPVTIVVNNNGRTSFDKIQVKTALEDNTLKDLNTLFRTKFSKVFLAEKEIRTLLEKEKILKPEKDEIKAKFNYLKTLLTEEFPFIETEISDFISQTEEASQERFINGIKSNLFGLTEEIKLLENKVADEIIENDYQGILVLKTVSGLKNTLVKDYYADNGISLTLYKAIVKVIDGVKIIEKTDEVLVELKMSSTQFSNFITSFGQGSGTPCTYTQLYGETVDTYTENVEDEMITVYNLKDFVNNINSEMDNLDTELNELTSKSISNEKRRQINFVFEKISRLPGGNLMFYVKNVFNSGLIHSLKRQEDVQSGVFNGIYKKGLKSFKSDIKEIAGNNANDFIENLK